MHPFDLALKDIDSKKERQKIRPSGREKKT